MNSESLISLLKERTVVAKEGIHVTNDIAEKTIWDELAIENPTNAVISAPDEIEAKRKSAEQIADIKRFVKTGDIVLDCGTGYGRVAKYLLPDMKLGGYIGLDSSYEMLTLFKQRYDQTSAEQETPLMLVNADIHSVPLKDNTVDVVLVSAVFLHNHKSIVAQSIQELKRVLKPNGTFLVYASFPRAATAMGVQGTAYQALLNMLGKPYKNGPVRYYRKKEIVGLFDGFEEFEIRPVGFSIIPKTIVGLPRPIETLYRVGFANPTNKLLKKITPEGVKPYFAVHYDVYAKR